jgi:5-methylcytosine-specific restriction protein A
MTGRSTRRLPPATLPPRIGTADTRRVRPMPANVVDPELRTRQHRAWRAEVLRRAGYRCEARDEHGHRCTKTAPHCRLYADHVVERADGGALFDVSNGQALCGQHHVVKTVAARRARR